MKQVIGAQGEITIFRIDRMPEATTAPVERSDGGTIISHSESGHHHVLSHGDVMERRDAPAGMRVLYAIVDRPARLYQSAAVPHEPIVLDPGLYEFRCAREFDPFSDQARRVAD